MSGYDEDGSPCQKCGCPCLVVVTAGIYYRACEACGFWVKRCPHDDDGTVESEEGGGFGVVVYAGKEDIILSWRPLIALGEELFSAEELEQLAWAWVSRPRPDGRWEGVMLKGEPRNRWPAGLLPFYEEIEE